MESPRGVDEPFPEGDVVGELDPGATKDFTVDSVSANVAKSKERKEAAEAQAKKKKEDKEQEKKDAVHTIKSAIIISGVVVAVIGAIFAITKKLREK